jgi:prepilin-type N-terminal cleavage/methylation domain-containing protein
MVLVRYNLIMNKNNKKQKGFTLIELLVVISVIAILAAIAIFGIGNVFRNARNTERISDLKQYQSALEVFANANDGLYPERTADDGQILSTAVCETDLGLDNCPEDPLFDGSSGSRYRIETDGEVGGGCTPTPCELTANYVMWTQLEPESDDIFWVVCSTGESGEFDGEPYATEGVCPL